MHWKAIVPLLLFPIPFFSMVAEGGRSQSAPKEPPLSEPATFSVPVELTNLQYTREKYDRLRALYLEGAVSRQQLEQAEQEYQIALANYQRWLKQPRNQPTPQITREVLQAELAAAEARVQQTRLELDRYSRLYQEGAIPQDWVTQAMAAYKAAIAEVTMLQQKLATMP